MKIPLKEIQATRTQRPTASSSCPYVEIALGDAAAQRTMQLQLEQVGPGSAQSALGHAFREHSAQHSGWHDTESWERKRCDSNTVGMALGSEVSRLPYCQAKGVSEP